MRRIVKDFLKGLVVVVPVVTTIYLVWLPLLLMSLACRSSSTD